MSDKVLTLGLIGAGAIARHAYFPVFKEISGLRLTAIVEPNEKIRQSLQDRYSLNYLGDDIKAAIDHVDAVIICVPNYLHYNIAKFCLEKGKHVLCEKPVCINLNDAENLVETAKRNSLVFTAAHVRRFYPAVAKIKEMIAERSLGALTGFDFREGTVFSWQTVSGFTFDKEKAGGGVLMDIGVHLLDLLFWWIDDKVASFQYADDSLGGVEATAEIQITFRRGIAGHVKLTRLAVLNNFYTLYFERGTISWNPFAPSRIYIRSGDDKTASLKIRKGQPVRDMLMDFSGAILGKRPAFVKGEEAIQGLQFIEACYASRKAIPMPWIIGGTSF